MSGQKFHKVRLSKAQRLKRLVLSVLDPRAWGHAIKVMNYYNYTNAAMLRQVLKRGSGGVVSPLANFANPQNLIIGNRVRISANVHLWPGPGTGRIILQDDVMIGPAVMISAANYRYNDGTPVTEQAMNEADIVIGRDTWIGYGAVILAGTEIGEGSIIGAASVVRGNIPPFSIVSGNPAVVVGRRTLPGAPTTKLTTEASSEVLALIRAELPGLDSTALEGPLDASGIDSFDLIGLRTALEERCGVIIPDAEWARIETLFDIARLPALVGGVVAPHIPVAATSAPIPETAVASLSILGPGKSRRVQPVNMPQMALSGLSEAWLFKELGDIHWAMITDFLQSSSSAIIDDAGDRLYATFTRIQMEMAPSLRGFAENSVLQIDSGLERQGAGFFFGTHDLTVAGAGGRAKTMSTFAKYGEHGKNTSLIKGSPTIPDPRAIPSLPAMPEFGVEYRSRRAAEPESEVFSCNYEILPPHDINGVGLLYFAAYPTIFDLCLERAEGKGFLMDHSTVGKDICYYANSDPSETLRFALHSREVMGDLIIHKASLFRTSDGKRMSDVISRKRQL